MLVDANLLLYAVNTDARHHVKSLRWLEESLSGTKPVLFPWMSLLAFLRLSTSRSAFSEPLTTEEAFDYVESWLAAPPASVAAPTAGHLVRVREMLGQVGTAGNLTNDAHLAAMAIEHGVPVVSFDNDFDRFVGVERLQPGPG